MRQRISATTGLANRSPGPYLRVMSAHTQPDPTETAAERDARTAAERAALDDAERLFEQEGGIPLDEVIAWVEVLGDPQRVAYAEAEEIAVRQVIIGSQAALDLEGIRRWQFQPGSGLAARRRVRRILAAIEGLADHPSRHPRGDHGRREFTVEKHRVVYRVTSDTGRDSSAGDVVVLRVFGPGQDRRRG